MIRYFSKTIQGRIIGLFVIFMTLVFALSFYTIRYTAQNALADEKESKLLDVAIYQDRILGELDYDTILEEAGAAYSTREGKIAVLNRVLAERTDEAASLFPGLGTGYYSIELDAMLTYGPSDEYGDWVGGSIAADHPGRIVMSENTDMVRGGSMIRGHIMNAMHPIVRGGRVIGYTWANELTSDIEQEYQTFSNSVIILLSVFYVCSLVITIMLSRRMVRNVDVIIQGVKNMRGNLATRIENVDGELGEIADNINSMAKDIEKSAKEHEALLKAEAANSAQKEFLSRMSHEIRTPMNAVIGMTAIAQQTNDTEKIHDYLEKINGAANHLLGVINDVLDMSKIEAGKLELSKTSFSIKEMLEQVVTIVRFKMEEKHQDFTLEIGWDVPEYIVTDHQRLAQVITNLLSNANKFTPEYGNIQLRVNLTDSENGKCRLRVEVQDDGIGISQEQQAKLFQSFEQADSSTARKYGGTGLGLAISKRIIELMKGSVWVESALDQGANFIFEVEAGISAGGKNEMSAHAETWPEIHSVDNSKKDSDNDIFADKHILLVEDVEINREIVLALLEPTRIEIDCAENGAEAVRLFGEMPEKYDLIFMDVQMPEMDGYEAAQHIRSLNAKNAKTIPIIAMTANVFKEDIAKCLKSGMNEHVGKPLDMGKVLAVLEKYLNRDEL